MASIIRRSGLYVFKHTNSYSVSPVACRLLSSSKDIISKDSNSSGQIVTHTGQVSNLYFNDCIFFKYFYFSNNDYYIFIVLVHIPLFTITFLMAKV